MKEMLSRIPALCPVDVKNVKTLDTSDGYAMTATLYWKGKRTGVVENHGTGGSNEYRPWEIDRDDVAGSYARFRDTMAEVNAYADELYGDGGMNGMNLDLLVEELIGEKDLARESRKEQKRGARFVAVAFKGAYSIIDGSVPDESTDPGDVLYRESYIVGSPSRERFIAEADEMGIEAYRVLHDAHAGSGVAR